MKAIVLAGGEGTRLYPVTLETPKPLITIKRKPILTHLTEHFSGHGINEMGVIVRQKDKEEFVWWLKRWQSDFPATSVTFFEEEKPMGTIGYVARHLKEWLGSEPFFISNGDELKQGDLGAMRKYHESQGGLATIALVSSDTPEEYGVPIMEGNYIIDFLEKPKNPPTNLINSGLYFFEPEALGFLDRDIKEGKEFLTSEKDLFPRLAKEKKLFGFTCEGKWFDCGNLERWERAMREW